VSPTGTSDTPNTDDDGERRDTPNIDLPDIQCITGHVTLTPRLHALANEYPSFRDLFLSDNVSPADDVERAQRRGRRALVKAPSLGGVAAPFPATLPSRGR